MGPERAVILIPDIGGYTEYMRSHRMSRAHAEVKHREAPRKGDRSPLATLT